MASDRSGHQSHVELAPSVIDLLRLLAQRVVLRLQKEKLATEPLTRPELRKRPNLVDPSRNDSRPDS